MSVSVTESEIHCDTGCFHVEISIMEKLFKKSFRKCCKKCLGIFSPFENNSMSDGEQIFNSRLLEIEQD
jgi:hypothetical protein